MPKLEDMEEVLEAASELVRAVRKAYPSADKETVKEKTYDFVSRVANLQ